MLTFILVILIVSLLVLVHEWGHFYSARKLKVKVEEFGFGFPPRVFSTVKNGIRYSFNLLPLGGFVKIFGEHGEGEGERESFAARPIWQRFIILFAGVFMNLVLAWVFFSIGSGIGVPQVADDATRDVPVSIIAVLPDSPADQAGLKFGDQVIEMRRSSELSLRIESEEDVREFTDAYRGEEITLVVRRGEEVKEIKAVPRAHIPEGEGPLGIALGRLVVEKTPWYVAPFEGLRTLWRTVYLTLTGLGGILMDFATTGSTSAAVSGPVGIFAFAHDSRSLGVSFFLQFVGILSVNLAILNFLPIPALDGGRILFLLIEKIRGARISPAVENMVHTVGFVVLILLMLAVTYRDVARIL